MAKIKRIIEQEILDILDNIEINEEELSIKILVPLTEKMYVKINKIFELMGGKWNTKLKKHVFKYNNLTEQINQIKSEGKTPIKNPYDYFPTPETLARELVLTSTYLKDKDEVYEILEPSAGTGRIAKELREFYKYSNINVCEIDEYNVKILEEEGFEVVAKDFLTLENKEYDLIVMNPPFNINNNSQAYIIHIMKSFDLLKKGGNLISIAPKFSSSDKKTKEFYDFVLKYGSFKENEKNSFKESKTNVETVTIILKKG